MTFFETITAAVNDIAAHGFDSMERVNEWMGRIRAAAVAELVPEAELERVVQDTLRTAYSRMVDQGQILRHHPGLSRFTLQQVTPALHSELNRRIMASAQLIKLNRAAAVERTLQRFSGWATSVPEGGSDVVAKRETKTDIRKALAQLPFQERRVAIDQAHKFTANLSTIIAEKQGAIAGRWHSHWRQPGYRYREDHKERDLHCYAVRGNWALERGLMNKGAGYTDEQTMPGEEVFCRCFYQWLYNLRDLPHDMLTAKGRAELERVRIPA